MIALILAAGYGTRMYPLTKETPKALLPVGELSILDHLMKKLKSPEVGLTKLVLVSNSKYAGKFQEWAKDSSLGIPIQVLDDGSTSEENRLGSVGDIAYSIRTAALQEDDLLILGSDNLFEDDLQGFVRFAKEKSPGVTLGAYELPDKSMASKYGVLTVEDHKVVTFQEKPKNPTSSLVSTAVYFFPRQAVRLVLEYVGSAQSADTLGSFIQWLITRESVFAFLIAGRWFDIGDLASYTNAQESFA